MHVFQLLYFKAQFGRNSLPAIGSQILQAFVLCKVANYAQSQISMLSDPRLNFDFVLCQVFFNSCISVFVIIVFAFFLSFFFHLQGFPTVSLSFPFDLFLMSFCRTAISCLRHFCYQFLFMCVLSKVFGFVSIECISIFPLGCLPKQISIFHIYLPLFIPFPTLYYQQEVMAIINARFINTLNTPRFNELDLMSKSTQLFLSLRLRSKSICPINFLLNI